MPPADPARAPLSPPCPEGDPSSALRSLPQESAASRLRALAENRLKPVGASPSGSCLTWARKDTEGINNPLLSCRPVLTRPHPTSSETAARRSRAHAVEGDASRASLVAGDSAIVTSRGRRAARQACAACRSEVPAAVSEPGCHLTGREGHEVPRRPAPRAHLRARARGVRSPRHAARRSESEGPCGGSARRVHAQAEALSGFALGTPQPDGEASVTPRVAAAPYPPRARRLGADKESRGNQPSRALPEQDLGRRPLRGAPPPHPRAPPPGCDRRPPQPGMAARTGPQHQASLCCHFVPRHPAVLLQKVIQDFCSHVPVRVTCCMAS